MNDRVCLQCGKPLPDSRRSSAVFCRGQKCKRRYYRARSSYYQAPEATGTPGLAQSHADDRFREALARHHDLIEPLSDYERQLLATQKRNPGPLIPELAAIVQDRAIEQQRRELAETSYDQAFTVETPASQGSMARRARQSRHLNRPVDPHRDILRPPGRSGHGPRDNDLPEMIDWPDGRNVVPWR